MTSSPLVSLIMPSFGMELLVGESVESVLNQTYGNFELIAIVERGPSRDRDILSAYAARDSRVKVVENTDAEGYIGLLLTGLGFAKGDFVGRADADDICLPNRLAQQVAFFAAHPEVGVCGTWAETFGRVDGVTWKLPTSDADIRARMLFCGAIVNPTVLWRRSLFGSPAEVYGHDFPVAEDYELLTRLPREVILANVPKVLVRYRTHWKNLGTTRRALALEMTRRIHLRQLASIGLAPTAEELDIHSRLGSGDFAATDAFIAGADRWLERIRQANDECRTFDAGGLARYLDTLRQEMARRRSAGRSDVARRIASRAIASARRIAPVQLQSGVTGAVRGLRLARRMAGELAPRLRTALKVREQPRLALAKSLPAKPRIGMAVLVHERPDYLQKCLDSLFATRLHDYDVTFLLIDDGSKDPRVREIMEVGRDEAYRIIRIYAPKGPNNAGAAINRAMRELVKLGNFDIVGWSDPDALYHPDWLDRLIGVARWAKANHTMHGLGPFSSFNSSDYRFHGVLGTFASPDGNYVVKRQMGMLNYFYFTPDFDALGFFEENPDDETRMTRKFAALKVRNFCTETSYTEHLGQDSVLNAWRPIPVNRAVSGLHLAREGWPATLQGADTLGYYRDVKRPASLDVAAASPVRLDVVIPAIDKDARTLPLAVRGLRENLAHRIGDIFVLGPVESGIRALAVDLGCRFVDERALLPFGKEQIAYNVKGHDRAGWLYQQLLKLAADAVASSSEYLLLDADTVLTKKQAFMVGDRHVLLHSDEFHKPYFDVASELLGMPPQTLLSCVAHNMLISVSRLKALREHLERRHGRPWHAAILDAVDYSQVSGFSEYELYGQWCLACYPDATEREYFFNLAIPRTDTSYETLHRKYGAYCRSVSIHSYLGLAARLRALTFNTRGY
jgi:glycosyltransferase involved in cell wall biosynthesis